jgi:hypothetical protein
MKTVQHYFNLAEGLFAQSLLEASGIDASLLDQNSADIGTMFAGGGMRLQVAEEDADRAVEILARHVPETDGAEPA